MRIQPPKCFLDLKGIHILSPNLSDMTRVEWEGDTDTVRKLSFVVRDARTKRFELWRVASEASFVGDSMGKDGSPVGCREWHKQVSGSIHLNSCRKVSSASETSEETCPGNAVREPCWWITTLGCGLCGEHSLSSGGRWAWREPLRDRHREQSIFRFVSDRTASSLRKGPFVSVPHTLARHSSPGRQTEGHH